MIQREEIDVPNELNWKEEGFKKKDEKFVWTDSDILKLKQILKDISKDKSVVHTNPNNLGYWMSQHRFDREIPIAAIQKQIRKLKRDQDFEDANRGV